MNSSDSGDVEPAMMKQWANVMAKMMILSVAAAGFTVFRPLPAKADPDVTVSVGRSTYDDRYQYPERRYPRRSYYRRRYYDQPYHSRYWHRRHRRRYYYRSHGYRRDD